MTHFLPSSPAAPAAGSASWAAGGIGRGNNTTNSSRLLGSRQEEKEMEEEEAEEGMNPPLEKKRRRRRKGMMLVKDINDPRGEEEQEEEGPSDHPPHKNPKKSIFVPLLNSKIGAPPALEVPREMAPSAGNDYCHRPMKLAILMSLLLLTGTFALFDSLIDNSSQEDEDSNGQEVKTDDELSEDDVKVSLGEQKEYWQYNP
jgi:hypothetical protein